MNITRIIFIIALSLLIIPFTYSQKPALQLTIKADKEVYETGEVVKIGSTLENKSGKSIYFIQLKDRSYLYPSIDHKIEYSGAFFLEVKRQNRKERYFHFLMLGPGPEIIHSIKPNESLMNVITFSLNGEYITAKALPLVKKVSPSAKKGITLKRGTYNLTLCFIARPFLENEKLSKGIGKGIERIGEKNIENLWTGILSSNIITIRVVDNL